MKPIELKNAIAGYLYVYGQRFKKDKSICAYDRRPSQLPGVSRPERWRMTFVLNCPNPSAEALAADPTLTSGEEFATAIHSAFIDAIKRFYLTPYNYTVLSSRGYVDRNNNPTLVINIRKKETHFVNNIQRSDNTA